jgi:phosphatidylglycerol:prolipoprotein diacylglycerol transferase
LIIGLFAMLYAVMRSFCELFREPDAQLGFLFNTGLTMGMVLSVPLFLAGLAFAAATLHRRPA